MTLGIYSLPLRVLAPATAPLLSGLSDTPPSTWEWAAPGTYGLADDGSGGWLWSAAPLYRLDSDLAWSA